MRFRHNRHCRHRGATLSRKSEGLPSGALENRLFACVHPLGKRREAKVYECFFVCSFLPTLPQVGFFLPRE